MKPNDIDGCIPVGDEQIEIPDRKNVLVQWQGGGYAGCMWEPNTGFFDNEGEWHPVISTGVDTRDTRAEFERKKDDERDLYFDIDREGLLEFGERIRDDFCIRTLIRLEEAGYEVAWKCDACDKIFTSMDDFSAYEGYKGDGGIGVIHEGKMCSDCHASGSCDACGEYSPDNMRAHHCEYCFEKFREENEELDKALAEIDTAIDVSRDLVEKYLTACPHKSREAVEAEHEAGQLKLYREKWAIENKIVGNE